MAALCAAVLSVALPARADAPGTTVVMLRARTTAVAQAAALRAGLKVINRFDLINVVVARGSKAGFARAAADPAVVHAERDRALRLLSTTSSETIGANRVHDGKDLRDAAGLSIDGRGVSIAVIDSGVDPTHPMLRGRVARNLRFVGHNAQEFVPVPAAGFNDRQWVELGNVVDADTTGLGGHGTHVAGIAAGNRVTYRGAPLRGTAPGAKIVSLAVATGLSVYGSDAALYWVLQHHAKPCQRTDGTWYTDAACPPIRVVNNSYAVGAGDYEFDPDRVTSLIQGQLLAAGVVTVWANGNTEDGGAVNRSNGFALDPRNGVISVGATDDHGTADRESPVYFNSSVGQFGRVDTYPDLVAPGVAVVSACRATMPTCQVEANSDIDKVNLNERLAFDSKLYRPLIGTSMAAPAVAGAVALVLQANPALTPAEIELLLENTAHRFANRAGYEPDRPARNATTPTSFDAGHGLLDVASAVGAARRVPIAARPTCSATAPVLRDPWGDASLVESLPSPLPSADNLDVRSLELAWRDGTLTATLRVTDLDADPLGDGFGPMYEGSFVRDDKIYRFRAERGAPASLTVNDVASGAATAVFDDRANTVTWTLRPATAFADGDVLGGLGARGDRRLLPSPLAPVADGADYGGTNCWFRLGSGAFAPPTKAATPELVAGVVTTAAPFIRSQPLTLSVDEPLPDDQCFLPTSVCTTFRVRVETNGALALVFRASSPAPTTNDLNLWLIGPDGQRWRANSAAGNETVTVPKAATGTYTVSVEQQQTRPGGNWRVEVALSG